MNPDGLFDERSLQVLFSLRGPPVPPSETAPVWNWARLDLRSLALLRIGCGLTLLLDLAERSTRLVTDYTDAGLLPRSAVPGHPWLSLHLLGGGPLWQTSLFLATAAAALGLALGWRTRLMAFLCWWLTLSLHHRNPLILTMGDGLLRLTLFWGLLLPWGQRWALDHPQEKGPGTATGPACAGYLLQMALVYPMTAWLKSGPEWHAAGNAVYHALTAAQYETPAGQWLRQLLVAQPGLDHALTWGVLALEFLLGPLLLWPRTRALGVAAVWTLQLGLGTFLSLGFFPLFASLAVLGLLPLPGAGQDQEHSSRPRKALVLLVLLAGLCQFLTVVPRPLQPLLNMTGFDQDWHMFAPSPPTQSGWYVAVGTRPDGRLVELLGSVERPPVVPRHYGGMRPVMYCFRVLTRRRWASQRPVYADFLARRYGQPLTRIQLLYFRTPTRPYAQEPPPERVVIWESDRT